MLHDYLSVLSDRRQSGKIQFDLATIVALSIEGIERGANNYALIHTYIACWYEQHKAECELEEVSNVSRRPKDIVMYRYRRIRANISFVYARSICLVNAASDAYSNRWKSPSRQW